MSFLSVRQLTEKYPAFSEASLRYYIFHRQSNGLSKCIRRVGRKILFHETDFLEWVNSQREPAG